MCSAMKFTKNCEKQCKKHTKTPKPISSTVFEQKHKNARNSDKNYEKTARIVKARAALCSGKIMENCANIFTARKNARKKAMQERRWLGRKSRTRSTFEVLRCRGSVSGRDAISPCGLQGGALVVPCRGTTGVRASGPPAQAWSATTRPTAASRRAASGRGATRRPERCRWAWHLLGTLAAHRFLGGSFGKRLTRRLRASR